MDVLRRSDLQQLVQTNGKWHISIYIPMHRAGNEQQQDPIRLKNLMAQAEKKLLDYEVRRPDVQKLLRPAEDLLVARDFWQHPGDGLAMFLSKDASRIYRLPERFDEAVVVGRSFYVQPLLPLLNGNGSFYVLVISLNQTRLFQASRDNLSEVELKDMPTNMGEALQIDDLEKHFGFQTNTDRGNRGGERSAVFYGRGEENDKKEKIWRYFQELDHGITRMLEDDSKPMVVAAVDYLIPLYQQANTYRNLLKEGVVGSPDRQDLKELHSLAWKVVEPIFMRNQQEAIDRFQELHGQQNGLAVSDLDSAVKAAIGGRVETLIVPLGFERWGHYDPTTDSVRFDPELTPENEDMVNYAVTQTLLNSGNVYAVPKEQFPNHGEVAAILRYVI